MSANGEINNTLKLNVDQFDQALQKASDKLNAFDNSLGKIDSSTNKLEKLVDGLSGNVKNLTNTFNSLESRLTDSIKAMSGVRKNSDSISNSFKKTDKAVNEAGRSVEKTSKKIETLSDFTKVYEKRLKSLNPLIEKTSKGQQVLEEQSKSTGKEIEKLSEKTLANNAKVLQSEIRTNQKILEERREMAAKAAQIQKRAEVNLAVQQKLYSGTFFGKNKNSTSEKAVEMRQNIDLWRKEAEAAKAVKDQIFSVIRDIEYQNGALKNGVSLIDQQLARTQALALQNKELANQQKSARQQQLQAEQQAKRLLEARKNFVGPPTANNVPYGQHQASLAQARQSYLTSSQFVGPAVATQLQKQMQAYYENSKNFIGPLPANHLSNIKSYGQQQAASQQQNALQQQMHQQQMSNLRLQQQQMHQMHKEQTSFAKEIIAMYVGLKIQQGIGGTVHKNMELEQSQFRVGLWNLPKDEQQRFLNKSKELTKSEKYLTQNEAIDARLDAMAAMGGNHEKTIDATLATATRVAHILRATGNETGSNSDLVKNLYGAAEARNVMNNPDEVNKTFEMMLKMSNISNGKLKVADIETVMRNMGSMRADVSTDAWYKIAALAEQFKTAGGGNGGGGGVASVGTMLKMLSIYGSGRTITNRAVTDLVGADILNDGFDGGDASKAFKNNAKDSKAFTKLMKNAGFKDLRSLTEDPVTFVANMRGQLLDYMMQNGNFERFFGKGTKRWTYDKKGQMINNEGNIVDRGEQNKIEQAGFTRLTAGMGWSNKMVDAMTTMLNKNFIDRANEVAESAKKSADSQQALKEAQDTLKGSADNLMASLGRLAESFAPLLPLITGFTKGLSGAIDSVAGFMSLHPSIAMVTGLGVAFGATALSAALLFGKINLLGRIIGVFVPSFFSAGKVAQQTAVQFAASGSSATTAGAAISGMANGTAGVTSKVSTMSGRVLGLLTGILKWAGWIGLGLLVGQMFISWIDSVNKNETPLRTSFQRLVQGLRDDLISGLQGLHTFWNNTLIKLGIDTENARRNLQELENYKGEVLTIPVKGMSKEEGGGFTSTPKMREVGDKITSLINKRDSSQAMIKAPTSVMGLTEAKFNLKQTNAQLANWQKALNQAGLIYIEKGPYAGTVVTKAEINKNNKLLKTKQASAAKATNSLPSGVLPTPSDIANYNSGAAPAIGGGDTAPKVSSGSKGREWNNLFRADVTKARQEAQQYDVDISELLGEPVNYATKAKSEFVKRWMEGKWDDNNDPRSRPFAKGAYNSETGWLESQIDWNGSYKGMNAQDALDAFESKFRTEDSKAATQFAAERNASTLEDFRNTFEEFINQDKGKSDALMALERQFSRYEVRNPIARENSTYQDQKTWALNNQVAKDSIAKANDSKNTNKQLGIDLLDSDVDRRKASADFNYNEVSKEINSQRKALQDRIDITGTMMDTDANAKEEYNKLIKVQESSEIEFTQRLILENEKRVRASESATQQMLRQYADLKAGIEDVNKTWTGKAIDSVSELITGKMSFKDFDWRQIGSDIFADYANVLVKDSASKLITSAMGDQSVFDMAKSLMNGKAAGGTGWISEQFNKWRGLGPYATSVDPQTGESTDRSIDAVAPLFERLKTSITPLTQGMSNLWESVSSASQGLWTFASDAIVKAINALIQWATSLLASSSASTASSSGSWLSTLFQAGSAYMSGSSGASGGGGTYAGINSDTGTYGMFAKGGVFSNSIIDDPTPFKFAKGGSFKNGLMGEAGPEAVMPLTRDSSGRLGVSIHEGASGGGVVQQNYVTISIDVKGDGSSNSTSSGANADDYKEMSKQIEAIVVDQVIKQTKPGGALYKK